jgi:tRNA-binding protein
VSVPMKPPIPKELLDRIDIRVGTIVQVNDVPGSDKLVALRVRFGGGDVRTILAGMKQERANPREIEGRQALFVVNLEPRRMRGILSEGMLFDLGYEDGIRPVLAVPESPVPDGTRAG